MSYLRRGLGAADETLPEMPEAQWRDLMLKSQNLVADELRAFARREEFQRWVQIAATLSIPLAAAIWKAILGRRRSEL